MIFQGIRTSIGMKPYIFVIFFRGGGFGPPAPHPLDPCMLMSLFVCKKYVKTLNVLLNVNMAR